MTNQDTVPWVILGVIAAGFAVLAVAWLGGTLGAAASGAGWHPPPFTLKTLLRLLFGGGPATVWPGAAPAWVWAGILTLAVLAAAAASGVTIAVRRRLAGPPGLARRRDLAGLLPQGAAARARQLRPSLAGVRHVDPRDAGVLLGDLDPRGPELRASWEDVLLAIMAPRAGKTTGLAVPAILGAPGPVLVTSNKADVYAATVRARATRPDCPTCTGDESRRDHHTHVWVLDPQGIAHVERGWWWNMLASAYTIEGARRLASHFVASLSDAAARKDFWNTAAHNTLTALFLAAARSGRTVTHVLAWLAKPGDRTPVDALHAAGLHAMAEQLASTVAGAVETRDGIYETARQAVACLLDPRIAAWVTPDPHRPEFKPEEFIRSRDTLYLLSKEGGGSAAGVIAAAADAVIRAAVAEAERRGGRLDPPLIAVLDEAANVCRIEDLPELYSHLGSRGVIPITILQSYRQGARVWGEAGMDALWGAATVKLLGAGLDDARFVDDVSRLVGEHDVDVTSVSRGGGGRSVSVSPRRERILPADKIRALPKGRALLLVTGVRAALVKLRPWYAEPGADRIAAAVKAEEHAIAERAKKALTR
ncbi:membrane protein [Carbonactinospora thermoautotrophica]|uniref:Membrane protein n=2 Tax=Carbonactinospora thermoautotrophica TaxID=1469144 RepID=A0A132N6Z8_9ACTN|nr:membrane protein [Carbonactinospora thermoautotrophica]